MEVASSFQGIDPIFMSSIETTAATATPRAMRADARRNHEKLVLAAHEAFAETGVSTSLEEIARRAGVGIGTLYRNFPNRQTLLEAVYVNELQALCRTADELRDLPAWEALVSWLHRFVSYLSTKQALAQEMLSYVDRDAELFRTCRAELLAAGEPLLRRAQEAKVARPDTNLTDVIQMVGGIAKIPALEPEQRDHILEIALDGLRYQR